MFAHDPYIVKAVEYLTGAAFLVLFIGFWQYVNGATVAQVVARAKAWSGDFAEWFRVPERLFYHPGHAWARADGDGVLTLGLDDFAQHLVGPIGTVALPQLGGHLERGAPAWTLMADGKAVPMLSPVSGTVVDVNREALTDPILVNDDPYGRGWLLKVRPPRPNATAGLFTGERARQWMHGVSDQLLASMTPALGTLAQDGGMPIHGLARGLDEEHWDEIARRFLLS